MSNRTLSTCFGILLGLCLALFLWELFVEHITLFIIFPVFPAIGLVIGLVLGLLRRLPPLKISFSLLVCTILIGTSVGYTKARGFLLRSRRENIASSISMQYPNSTVITQQYRSGNGMEEPPNVLTLVKSHDSYEQIYKYYYDYLRQNNWQYRPPWTKKNYQIFIRERKDIEGTNYETFYQVEVDFLGYWMTDFFQIEAG